MTHTIDEPNKTLVFTLTDTELANVLLLGAAANVELDQFVSNFILNALQVRRLKLIDRITPKLNTVPLADLRTIANLVDPKP